MNDETVKKILKHKKSNLIELGLFKEENVDKVLTECNFNRGIGPDEFKGSCQKMKRIEKMLNDLL